MWTKTLDALKGHAALIDTCILFLYILEMYKYVYVLAYVHMSTHTYAHKFTRTHTWMCHQGCELVATGNVLCAAVSPLKMQDKDMLLNGNSKK